METLTNKRQHRGDKQTLANQRRRRSDSPPAAAGPACWRLIVNSRIDGEGSASDASIAESKTRAASFASSGQPFSVSLGVAAPPACCSLHFDWPGGSGKRRHGKHSSKNICVIAGHDDALIQMRVPDPGTFNDHFLCEAGGGWRPPSLLPHFNIPVQLGYNNHSDPTLRFRHLTMKNTDILRRRGDLVVVCQLEMTCDPPIYDTAELCTLRIGGRDREWTNRRLPIVEGSTTSSKMQPWRQRHHITQVAVPVDNRFLCRIDYSSGFILCDMGMAEEEVEETPKLLWYVPLIGY